MIPALIEIKLHKSSKKLELIYQDGSRFELSCQYLRVFTPSAQAKGQPDSTKNKQDVNILAIEPVGLYAVKLIFDDGHRTGLYTFDYLYELAKNYQEKWS